ncbi:hypothetical protein VTO73DRAFT_7637 [Trametes versicolor]
MTVGSAASCAFGRHGVWGCGVDNLEDVGDSDEVPKEWECRIRAPEIGIGKAIASDPGIDAQCLPSPGVLTPAAPFPKVPATSPPPEHTVLYLKEWTQSPPEGDRHGRSR